jgi:copper chaperone NosL
MKSRIAPVIVFFTILAGCGRSEVKPVDIYPEDMCSFCRMAFSDPAFASEIITENGEALKFDDIGCMEKYLGTGKVITVAASFVKDFETKKWIPIGKSTIVTTNLATPMGSGKIAFADSMRATAYLQKHRGGETAESKKEH